MLLLASLRPPVVLSVLFLLSCCCVSLSVFQIPFCFFRVQKKAGGGERNRARRESSVESLSLENEKNRIQYDYNSLRTGTHSHGSSTDAVLSLARVASVAGDVDVRGGESRGRRDRCRVTAAG